MQNTPLLPLLPGSLWLGVVKPDRVLSMGQIELNCLFKQKLNLLTIELFLHLTVCKLKINCVHMINWIGWNGTVCMYKNGFGIK